MLLREIIPFKTLSSSQQLGCRSTQAITAAIWGVSKKYWGREVHVHAVKGSNGRRGPHHHLWYSRHKWGLCHHSGWSQDTTHTLVPTWMSLTNAPSFKWVPLFQWRDAVETREKVERKICSWEIEHDAPFRRWVRCLLDYKKLLPKVQGNSHCESSQV